MKTKKQSLVWLLAVCMLAALLCGCGGTQKAAAQTCTLTIECVSVLDHSEDVAENKRELVPEDGFLLAETECAFAEGESAYELLQRICQEREIHLESSWSEMFNSAYIEGIGNLYEGDVGPESGWGYKVNGEFPPVGCSEYVLEDGDALVFSYFCSYAEMM